MKNKNYTSELISGLIGVRFMSRDNYIIDDENILVSNYAIDYNELINIDEILLKQFEKKYGVKISTKTHDYYHLFECTKGHEDELIKEIEKDEIVSNASRIDQRILDAAELGNLIENANEMFLCSEELQNKSDSEINKNIDNMIKLLINFKKY